MICVQSFQDFGGSDEFSSNVINNCEIYLESIFRFQTFQFPDMKLVSLNRVPLHTPDLLA